MFIAIFALLAQLQTIAPHAGKTALAGVWRLHLGDDSAWAQPAFDDGAWDTVTVPAAWSGAGRPSYRGFGWYRLHVAVKSPLAEPIGLWFRSVATAFEVYVDGQRIGVVGGFPPDYRPRAAVPLIAAFPPGSQLPGRHVIAVRVYSDEQVGGITSPVSAGPIQALQREAMRPDLYLLAAAMLLLGVGLVQIFFWLRRPLAKEHGAIFAVCLSLALFFVCWMPTVRIALEPYVHWLRLYFAFAALSAAAYCYAFRRIFDLDRGDRVVFGFTLLFLVQAPLFLALPRWGALTRMAMWLLNPSLLVAAVTTLFLAMQQLRQGERHARILLWGTLLLTVTLFHAVLVDWGLLGVQGSFPWLVLVGSVGFVISLALTTAERFVESETAALYDRLTGLYRREVVMDALAREIRRAARVRAPLGIIMLDVDRFKQINDTLGHQAGDKVLTELGRRMGEAGRAVDWLGRYGGEEFIAVLAGTGSAGARLAAERLRSAVAALPIATGRTARTITLSAGVAAYEGGEDWPTVEQLVGSADAALYRAKSAGRNCVMT
jgi:diguanylate cyclase (GGDEF)-like protein